MDRVSCELWSRAGRYLVDILVVVAGVFALDHELAAVLSPTDEGVQIVVS